MEERVSRKELTLQLREPKQKEEEKNKFLDKRFNWKMSERWLSEGEKMKG